MLEFIEIAHKLADRAGEIILPYFRAQLDIEHKEDKSPVTLADQGAERAMREILESLRPEDGIHGEEFGVKDSKNGYMWVLDPIDGTKPFITGNPNFGTLIALCKDGAPVLGVIDQPFTKDRWLGAAGQATTHNGKPVKTRSCAALKDAICASTAPGMFDALAPDFNRAWRNQVKFVSWGGDCISYALLSSGFIDLVLEAQMKPHDFMALVPVVEGAGGAMCDWQGQPLTLQSDGTVIALGDVAVLPELLAFLRAEEQRASGT